MDPEPGQRLNPIQARLGLRMCGRGVARPALALKWEDARLLLP